MGSSGEESEPPPESQWKLEADWLSCAPNEPKEVAMASAHSHAAALALKAEVAAKKTAQQKNEQEAEVASPAGVPEKEGGKGKEP